MLINKVVNELKEGFPAVVKTGRFREGLGLDANAMDAWLASGAAHAVLLFKPHNESEIGAESMTQITDAYEEAVTEISIAKDSYDKMLKEFRANIRNDLTSIAAAATKVKSETQSMNKAYLESIQTLTSVEMQTAINNAERLAAALTTLATINPQQFSFELLNKGE